MSDRKSKREFDLTADEIRRKYGPRSLQKGVEQEPRPESLKTGFDALDNLTGCKGVPVGSITLFSGRGSNGKATIAYKLLAKTQRTKAGKAQGVALFDLYGMASPDYLERCGITLERIDVARLAPTAKTAHLISDVARSSQYRLVVIDGLSTFTTDPKALQALKTTLRRLPNLLRAANCAMVLLDGPNPPWSRASRDERETMWQRIAVHIELRWERWIKPNGTLVGYQSRAELRRSRWAATPASATIEITFNGTVKAGRSW